jgi:hypothetical protein
MFQFPSFASATYVFSDGYPGITLDGLPHSEISGSKPVSSSPKLIAASYVLHRLPTPRHPPCALCCLTISLYNKDFSLLLLS